MDQVWIGANRPPKFIPFLSSVYISVFGEVENTTQKIEAIASTVTNNKDESKKSVIEILEKYNTMTDQEKIEFKKEILDNVPKEKK